MALGTAIPSLINTLLLRPKYTCDQLSIPPTAYYKIVGKGFLLGLVIFVPGYFIAQAIEVRDWITFILFGACISATYTLLYSRLVMTQKTAAYVIASVPQKILPFVKLFTGTQKS